MTAKTAKQMNNASMARASFMALALPVKAAASPNHASHERQHPSGDYDFQNL
jgi:hypothetical protein